MDRRDRPRLRDRSTGDLMVLMIAATICLMVVGTMGTIVVVEIVNPSVDTSGASRQITEVLSTLIGLLAGFLAGRTDANVTANKRLLDMEQELMKRPKPPEDGS